MGNLTHKHSLTNFWKIPSDLVSFDDGRTDTTKEQMVVSMPPQDTQTKPALYQWEKANLFAPVPGFNSKSNDISSDIRVDPASRTVSLPFNIDQAVLNLLTEQYIQQESNQYLFLLARQLYYKLKPLMPRFVQVQLRQKLVDYMSRRKFPTWAVDASVDLLHRNLLVKLLKTNPGSSSMPMISFWPQGADMCLLLTHDVESLDGIENIKKIINIEQKLGFRSVWNFVPEKYPLDPCILRELQASGFEIGVHGLYHDGRLFESYNLFQQHASKINKYLRQWGSVGFRSESNLRNLEWISKYIQAEYDTSCVSAEWYGAQPGGCCTVFPFIYRDLVELPITLQQDFTLLDILKLTPEETLNHWIDSVQSIKKINGLVLINVHPDYMTSPDRLKLYENFLEAMKSEMSCWHALPKEAARWWIDRNNSELSPAGAGWRIDGPASDRGVVMKVSLSEGKLRIQTDGTKDH
jgi:hypothetical protein